MTRPSAMPVLIATAVVLGFSAKALVTVTSGRRAAEDGPAAHTPRTPAPEMEMGFRAREVADRPWPDAVRLDVIYGRVRPGFTLAQMRMAQSTGKNRLGDPDRRVDDVAWSSG